MPSPSAAAKWQRAYRERQRRGLTPILMNLDHVSVVEELIAHGWLRVADYDNKAAITAALNAAAAAGRAVIVFS